MTVLETIKNDLISAFKKGDSDAVSVLRLVEATIKNKEIEKRTWLSKKNQDASELEKQSKLSDEEITAVLISEAKKRKEAIEQFQKGNRDDLVKKEEKEFLILQKYLPAQFSPEEIRQEVLKTIAELKPAGPADFGKIMNVLAARLKGKADGKIIAEILKKELEKS